MYLDRRGFFRVGLGGAVTMALSAVAPLFPTQAYAIAGVDDAVVGGVLLVMLTLAGYAVSAEVSQATLQAMGYSFSDFARDASNQQAAVTRAIADANNLGVQVNRQNAEDAAAAIAAGTGAIADWFADIAETGRMALDGIVNGTGAIPAALWGLVAEYRDAMLGAYETVGPDATFSNGNTLEDNGLSSLAVSSLEALKARCFYVTGSPTWIVTYQGGGSNSSSYDECWAGYGSDYPTLQKRASDGLVFVDVPPGSTLFVYNIRNASASTYPRSGLQVMNLSGYGSPLVSADIVTGTTLPGVDKAPDAPATLGAGYDKTVIGADAVYGADGDVVSAGTIAVPVQYPHVSLPYVDGLYGLGAGVVPQILDVPISGQTGVIVGTQEGVATMTITDAVATDSSIAEVPEPVVPVVPPGTPDVGPWQPAYDLPFYEVWPFNLVYTFVQQISALGGAS